MLRSDRDFLQTHRRTGNCARYDARVCGDRGDRATHRPRMRRASKLSEEFLSQVWELVSARRPQIPEAYGGGGESARRSPTRPRARRARLRRCDARHGGRRLPVGLRKRAPRSGTEEQQEGPVPAALLRRRATARRVPGTRRAGPGLRRRARWPRRLASPRATAS